MSIAPEKTSPTAQDVQDAIDELVSEGIVMAIQEIDPATGKLRHRYFHRDYAPKTS